MGVCKRARFGHRFERLRQQQEKAWWIKRRIHRRKHRPPAPFGRASLRSDFETHGRCKRSLAAIEGHELFDSHQFRCRNMDNVQTPRTVDRGMFFAEARRQAQNGRPHLTADLTNLPLCKSFWTFFHAAAASAFVSSLRKIPSLNAFRTSSACKGVRDKGAPVWSRYSLACDVWVSAM